MHLILEDLAMHSTVFSFISLLALSNAAVPVPICSDQAFDACHRSLDIYSQQDAPASSLRIDALPNKAVFVSTETLKGWVSRSEAAGMRPFTS